MRESHICAGSSAIGSQLSLEIAKLFDSQGWLCGNSAKQRPRTHRRALRIEPLELRQLMDAAGLAALISPTWFQSTPDPSGVQHAGVATWTADDTIIANQGDDGMASILGQADNLYDWIVQFDTASLSGITSVAETTSLLVGGGIDFQAIAGLGMIGQVLVRSSGAAYDDVYRWLAADADVAGFEQDAMRQLDTVSNDPQLGNLWGMTKISAPSAWSLSTGSQSVVVGIVDTGVDYNHPDLAANIWTNPGEIAGNDIDDDGNGFVDDIHGYDFVNNDGDPMDDHNHGTHVAGTIAAVGNNATGVTGVNWSSSIMALKFLSSTGSGYLSNAVRALNYATMMRSHGVNIRVTNNSWGGGGFSTSLQTAIQANSDAGILFVAAAGNSGANNDATPNYPSNYTPPNVIAVAASDSYDQLASFSCYGATTVDIAAPGVGIYSTTRNGGYGSMSGTSMATPHVAGVAALAFAAAPNATMLQVRDAILQGADPVAAFSGKMVTGARLNAYNTLLRLNAQPQGPAVGSLAIAPNPVMAGSVVTLRALGITDALGTVSSVSFYRDSNSNGQYDATDAMVGADTTIVNAEGSITLSTAGFTAGSYRYFARALDNGSRWSAATGAILTVIPGDEHGNNAATATAVAMPSATQGTLGILGDVDWFKFQAVVGQTYILSTELQSLVDSVLTLYDRDGTAQLILNDDDGASLASKITWSPYATGTYYVAVSAYGDAYAGTYLLNVHTPNTTPTPPSNGTPIDQPVYSDFNADGISDVLLHNQSTGEVGAWLVDANGTSNGWRSMGVAPATNWKVVGIGDFDADEIADVLLHNQTTGEVGAWLVKNGAPNGWRSMGVAPATTWKVVGVGDFDADGISDVLLHNQFTGEIGTWLVKNGSPNGWKSMGAAPATTWKVVGVGDFDANGISDVLLHNQSSGEVGAWLVHNDASNGWKRMGTANAASVKVVGVGDVDADGISDILLHNQSTGDLGAWLVKTDAPNGWRSIGTASAANWKVTSVGDFDADGIADVLLHHQSTGEVAAWLVKNEASNGWKSMGIAPAPAWRVVPGNTALLQSTSLATASPAELPILAQSNLQPIATETIARWAIAARDVAVSAPLRHVELALSDLFRPSFGSHDADRISSDHDATDNRWWDDATLTVDAEVTSPIPGLPTIDPRAVDRIDLLAVVSHELDHIAGFDNFGGISGNRMAGAPGVSIRQNAYREHVDTVLAESGS